MRDRGVLIAKCRTEILRKASVIAQDMGYRFVKNLRRSQILHIADKAPGHIDEATLDSFRNADLIMEVKDGRSHTNYIAVEASYTVHIRDVDEQSAMGANAGCYTTLPRLNPTPQLPESK